MAKLDVYNKLGEVVGQIELSDAVFAIEPNESVLHQVVKQQLANKRQGTSSTRTRTEVRGGGRKPWRQKGTGRARQGLYQSSTMGRRRNYLRTETARLFFHGSQETAPSGFEERFLKQVDSFQY